jgi:hypothetical protein
MRRNGADISKREEKGVEYALGYCTELMLLRDEVAAKPPQGPFRIKDNLERTEFIDDVVRTEYTKTFGQYVSTFKLTVPETQQEPDAAAALGAADGDDVAADGQPE